MTGEIVVRALLSPAVARFRCSGCAAEDASTLTTSGSAHYRRGEDDRAFVCGRFERIPGEASTKPAPKRMKTVARRFLDARSHGKRAADFLLPSKAKWHPKHGPQVIEFADGSAVWMHSVTCEMHEAVDVKEAEKKFAESIDGDLK